jgi:hypothetical protein
MDYEVTVIGSGSPEKRPLCAGQNRNLASLPSRRKPLAAPVTKGRLSIVDAQIRHGRFQNSYDCRLCHIRLSQPNSLNNSAVQMEGLFMRRSQVSR